MEDYFDPEGGDAGALAQLNNTPLMLQLAQAELTQAVTTARAFPRKTDRVAAAIKSLAIMSPAAAQSCFYSLPRKDRTGKTIQILGPSTRLAEIIASCWGNCNVGARIVAIDKIEKVVIVEGIFWDLETGMKRVVQTQRNISTSTGKLFSADMITVTANAAMSIATREAILKSVPRAVWYDAYEAALRVVSGDIKSLEQNRNAALAYFAETYKVSPERVFAALGVSGALEIGLDELAVLRTMKAQLKENEATVDSLFPSEEEVRERSAKEKADLRAAVTVQPPKQVEAKKTSEAKRPEPERKPAPEAKADVEQKQEGKTAKQDPAQAGGAVEAAEAVTEAAPQASLALDAPDDKPKAPPAGLTALYNMVVKDLGFAQDHSDVSEILAIYAENIAKIEAESPELAEQLDGAVKAARARFHG